MQTQLPGPQQQRRGRLLLSLILLTAGAGIGFTNFYLPYWSPEAAAARARSAQRRQQRPRSDGGGGERGGSVWANVGKQRDFLQQQQSQPQQQVPGRAAGESS